MSLPNYFLADLPPGTPMSVDMAREACETLKRNRERYLLPRTTESVIQTLADVAKSWLTPYSPWMRQALEEGPAATGFSREMLARGLERFFRQLTPRALTTLVVQELGHPQRLDRLTATEAEAIGGMSSHARGPELLAHITAGALPTPVFLAMTQGFLARSAQFVKCASGRSLLPRLFAHSVRDTDPKLAACLELAEWRGGASPIEGVVLGAADCVVASGSDETLEALRRVVPPKTRFLSHGHRVSAGYIAREALSPGMDDEVARQAAEDVAEWDQLGCLSPHIFFVERGGMLPPEGFAAKLADELAKLEKSLPRGDLSPEAAATIFQLRETYRIRALADSGTRCWFSPDSTAWSVVFEEDPRFQLSCLHRFIYVKAVDTLEECLRQAEVVRGQWSTVGLACAGARAAELAQAFANWGVTRVCPLGRMQRPPLTWRQDGRPTLGDLVTWTGHELPPDEWS